MLSMLLKISLSRFTNFVFPLLEWLSVLVTIKVLVKIHVKKGFIRAIVKFAHRVEIAGLRDS